MFPLTVVRMYSLILSEGLDWTPLLSNSFSLSPSHLVCTSRFCLIVNKNQIILTICTLFRLLCVPVIRTSNPTTVQKVPLPLIPYGTTRETWHLSTPSVTFQNPFPYCDILRRSLWFLPILRPSFHSPPSPLHPSGQTPKIIIRSPLYYLRWLLKIKEYLSM